MILIYLNLWESSFPRQWYDWLRDAIHNWLKEFGPVEIVLNRPNEWPGSYVEIRHGPSLEHMSRRMKQTIASLCTTRLFDAQFFGEWYPHVIWHDEQHVKRPDNGSPHEWVERIVAATVHEFGHALGWTIGPDGVHRPEEQSKEWWMLTKGNFSKCAANLARYKSPTPTPDIGDQ